MNSLEYVACIFFALAAVRGFSFGVYNLRKGNSAAFGLTLLLLAAGTALFCRYVWQSFM